MSPKTKRKLIVLNLLIPVFLLLIPFFILGMVFRLIKDSFLAGNDLMHTTVVDLIKWTEGDEVGK